MAMNKKEQAEMAALRRELLVAGAFVRTERVLPDVPPPKEGGYSTGFTHSSYGAEPAWSTSVSHGRGILTSADHRPSGSQNSRHLFSSKLLALKARRWEMEREFAEKLADIDKQIAAAAPQKKEG